MRGADKAFISVEVKTAGPFPGLYGMLAIGACLVSDPREAFYVEIRPEPAYQYIPDNVTAGWPEEQPALTMARLKNTGIPPVRALRMLSEWVQAKSGENTPVLASWNASFVWLFLTYSFAATQTANPFDIVSLDAKALWTARKATLTRDPSYADDPHLAVNMDNLKLFGRADDDAYAQSLLIGWLLQPVPQYSEENSSPLLASGEAQEEATRSLILYTEYHRFDSALTVPVLGDENQPSLF